MKYWIIEFPVGGVDERGYTTFLVITNGGSMSTFRIRIEKDGAVQIRATRMVGKALAKQVLVTVPAGQPLARGMTEAYEKVNAGTRRVSNIRDSAGERGITP